MLRLRGFDGRRARVGVGADLALPHVALGLLAQMHVRPEQRVNGLQRGSVRPLRRLATQQQPAMRPRRQRRVHQAPTGVLDGEVDQRAGAVHVGDEAAHANWQFLFAAHRREGGDGHVQAGGVLLDGVGEQRMR